MDSVRNARGGLSRTTLVKQDDLRGVFGSMRGAVGAVWASVGTLYLAGSKKHLSFGSQPPPGPPIHG